MVLRTHLMVGCLLALGATCASADTFDFGHANNGKIVFQNGSFWFASGTQTKTQAGLGGTNTTFTQDSSITAGSGDGVLSGIQAYTQDISGIFTIGAVNAQGAAPVSGTGLYTIKDSAGNYLTATLTFVNISVVNKAGDLNTDTVANLSSIQYFGTNSQLLALKNAGTKSLTVHFAETGATTSLASLKGTSLPIAYSNFTGSVTVPEAGFYMSSLLGLGALLFARQRRSVSKL